MKKTQGEIDREINEIYDRSLKIYEVLKPQYDQFMNERRLIDEKLDSIKATIEQANTTLETLQGDAKERHKTLLQLHLRLAVSKIGKEVLREGSPASAYRPPHFQLFDYALEERVIKEAATSE